MTPYKARSLLNDQLLRATKCREEVERLKGDKIAVVVVVVVVVAAVGTVGVGIEVVREVIGEEVVIVHGGG